MLQNNFLLIGCYRPEKGVASPPEANSRENQRTRIDQQLRVVMKVLYKLIRREDKLELLIDVGSSPLFCLSKVK